MAGIEVNRPSTIELSPSPSAHAPRALLFGPVGGGPGPYGARFHGAYGSGALTSR